MQDFLFMDDLVLRAPTFSYQFNHNKKIQDEIFLEAIYLASVSLFKSIYQKPIKNLKEKEILSLRKYMSRMSTRCTPFGLFAGCTSIKWGEYNDLIINESCKKRHTRLDMHYLCTLAYELSREDYIKKCLIFYPNKTLYPVGEKQRYIEYYYKNNQRVHRVSEIYRNEWIEFVLSFSKDGKKINEIVRLLCNNGFNEKESTLFVNELIDNQILESNFEPTITGEEMHHQLRRLLVEIDKLKPNEHLRKIIVHLKKIENGLKEIDSDNSININKYHSIINDLKELSIEFDERWIFQTDLNLSMKKNTLCNRYKRDLFSAFKMLRRINNKTENTTLEKFKTRFIERYGEKLMPILNVLDTENGIGYLEGQNYSTEFVSLLQDIPLKNNHDNNSIYWDKWNDFLVMKIRNSINNGKKPIKLIDNEIEAVLGSNYLSTNELPNTISMLFSHIGKSEGEEKLMIHSIGNSSGGALLARFAHSNESIKEQVKEICNFEKQINNKELIAEIVHLPEKRLGNILLRPAFYDYEIPFLAQSSVDAKFQISLSDLYITVRENRVILWSKELNSEVIPRLNSAHNYGLDSLPLYEFLCHLQSQGINDSLYFNWGSLSNVFRFLPRIEYKNTIFSPATWHFQKDDYSNLLKLDEASILNAVKEFVEVNELPRNIAVCFGDNELFIDTQNSESIFLLYDCFRKQTTIKIIEFLGINSEILRDTNGFNYTNEFIATLVKNKKNSINNEPDKINFTNHKNKDIERVFVPGSEWLYYKIYSGTKSADTILTEKIYPLVKKLHKKGAIKKWFFIRYADPETHIRLRLQVSIPSKLAQIIFEFSELFKQMYTQGLIWNINVDTYQREIERYGTLLIELSEELFFRDSEVVIKALSLLEGDEGEEIRWKFAMRSVSDLLKLFGLDLYEKMILMRELKKAFYLEFDVKRKTKKHIDNKFRKHAKEIEYFLEVKSDDNSNYVALFDILKSRDQSVAEIGKQIKIIFDNYPQQDTLTDFLTSHIHMMINRALKSFQREQELIVYDFLFRYFNSCIAKNDSIKKSTS